MKKKKFKEGDRVRIVSNTCSHYLKIGSVIILGVPTANGMFNIKDERGYMGIDDIEFAMTTKEDLLTELDEIEAKVDVLKSKMVFMEENGIDEYDEVEHQIYLALQVLKEEKTDIEKTRAIKRIIDNL